MVNDDVVTLGDALPREMARVRDELIPAYMAIGQAGGFALMFLRQDLDKAAQALASGDVVEMLRSYKNRRNTTKTDPIGERVLG